MIKGLLISLLVYSASTGIAKPTTNDYDSKDIMCLARNIYFEARDQSLKGQIAVAHVTLNRVSDYRFPNSICSVVTQARTDSHGNLIRHKCQFSWYCDGKSDTMRDIEEKEKAIRLAKNVIAGVYEDVTRGATHYHSTSVSPHWSADLKKVIKIEDHIFYKW